MLTQKGLIDQIIDVAKDILMGEICPLCQRGRLKFEINFNIFVCNNCSFRKNNN